MTNNVFKPNNFGVDGDILKMYFGDNDIILTVGAQKYRLEGDDTSIIRFDTNERKLINDNAVFNFKMENGTIVKYTTLQLFNFRGMKESIEDFAKGSLSDDMIPFKEETDKLMKNVMEFHKDCVVDKHLDSGKYEELQKLIEDGALTI